MFRFRSTQHMIRQCHHQDAEGHIRTNTQRSLPRVHSVPSEQRGNTMKTTIILLCLFTLAAAAALPTSAAAAANNNKRGSDWVPCGAPRGCYCSAPVLHAIQCTDVTVFPIFEDVIKPGVVNITISKSNIVGLPPFKNDEWNSLRYLNFIDTPMILCDELDKLKQQGLKISANECTELVQDCQSKSNSPNSINCALFFLDGIVPINTSIHPIIICHHPSQYHQSIRQ